MISRAVERALEQKLAELDTREKMLRFFAKARIEWGLDVPVQIVTAPMAVMKRAAAFCYLEQIKMTNIVNRQKSKK